MESFIRRQDSDPSFHMSDSVQGHNNMLSMSPVGSMDNSGMMGGDALDAIIMQNNREMERRRSVQQHNNYGIDQSRQGIPQDFRRTSMLEFSSPTHAGNVNDFQFAPPFNTPRNNGMQRNSAILPQSMQPPENPNRNAVRRQSTGNSQINSPFANIANYSNMGPNFQQSIRRQELGMNPQETFDQSNMSGMGGAMAIDFGGQPMDVSMFPAQAFNQQISGPHMPNNNPDFAEQLQQQAQDQSIDLRNHHDSDMSNTNDKQAQNRMTGIISNAQPVTTLDNSINTSNSFGQQPSASQSISSGPTKPQPSLKEPVPKSEAESVLLAPTNPPEQISLNSDSIKFPKGRERPQNAYSSTGFDMLSVLMRVATRPNPEINIGAVDMSCAFVVCDVSSHDLPIVYCSDIFERMTGYSRHEILGQNCRFLQSPTGKVQSGVPRKYCDDDTVLFLKKRIEARKEAQAVIINYRKGGHAFQNLLTMIPVTWDSDEIKYFVGFQTDLVEKPNSIIGKNADGTYSTNYQRGYVPRYVWSEPDPRRLNLGESGHTIPRDDVSTVLTTIGSGESELSRRIWDKVLLENTDDVVHVLSLKGLFLYLSPSSRKVLEYDSSELVGTALSSVCHPSDIVPVTRELKDTSTGASVNVVFRMRRKHSGYCWFESHGSLHTEQGKGRKCIILVGRERPVYALSRNDLGDIGGFSDTELWTKMSTSGMFLFVSSNSKQLLDRNADDLVGTSIQVLMRPDLKIEFGRILDQVRSGKRATFKHDLQHKRGHFIHATSIIYPGDAVEGLKPTFVVVQTQFQTRSNRSASLAKSSATPLRADSDPIPGTPASNVSGLKTAKSMMRRGSNPPTPSATLVSGSPSTQEKSSDNTYDPITSQAGGSGLPIGSQDVALASELNVFDELKTTRSTSWQFELRQMERKNRILKEELDSLLSSRRKRKRKKGSYHVQKECVNCHTKSSPEWRRGPSGQRDLCNSCGLRWTKQQGRTSPKSQNSGNASSPNNNSSPNGGNQHQSSPVHGKNLIPGNIPTSNPTKTEAPIPQTAHSFENVSATRPPKIEEQDEGDVTNGVQ